MAYDVFFFVEKTTVLIWILYEEKGLSNTVSNDYHHPKKENNHLVDDSGLHQSSSSG